MRQRVQMGRTDFGKVENLAFLKKLNLDFLDK